MSIISNIFKRIRLAANPFLKPTVVPSNNFDANLDTTQPPQSSPPAVVSPAQQPGVMKNEFQNSLQRALFNKMIRHIAYNYEPNMTRNELELSYGNPAELRNNRNIWENALSTYQQTLGEPVMKSPQESVPSAEILDDMEIYQIAQSFDKMPEYKDLPPAIRDNEQNLERFYDILSRKFMDSQQDNTDSSSNEFTNPLAKMFWDSYLDESQPESSRFHEELQGSDDFGQSTGFEIDKLDQALARVSGGYQSSDRYRGKGSVDPVLNFYLSTSAGMSAARDMGLDVRSLGTRENKIQALSKSMDMLENDFTQRMQMQDEDVFEYVKNMIRMKRDSAGMGAGSLVDQETGGTVEVGEDRGVSNLNQVADPSKGEGFASEDFDLLRSGFKSVPQALGNLGNHLQEKLLSRAEQTNNPKLKESAYFVSAFTDTLNKQMDLLYARMKDLESLPPKEKALLEKELKNVGISKQINLGLGGGNKGKFVWKFDPSQGKPGDEEDSNFSTTDGKMSGMAFSKLIPFDMIARDIIKNVDAKTGSKAISNQVLQISDQDRMISDKISSGLPLTPAETHEWSKLYKRFYTKNQFLAREIGKDVLTLLKEGKTDKNTVLSLFDLLKPHATSSMISRMYTGSRADPELSKWFKKQILKPDSWYNSKLIGELGKGTFPKFNPQQIIPNELQINDPNFAQTVGSHNLSLLNNLNDEQIKQYINTIRDMYYDSKVNDNTKRESGEYLGAIRDYGNPNAFRGRNRDLLAHYDLIDKVIKLSNLLKLRNNLAKFASIAHINDMIDQIIESTSME